MIASKESRHDSMNFSQTSSQKNINNFQGNMGFPPGLPNMMSNMMQSNMMMPPNF